jgi:hypothetical protein
MKTKGRAPDQGAPQNTHFDGADSTAPARKAKIPEHILDAVRIVSGWKGMRDFTARGGGGSRSTRALRRAMAKAHKHKLPREARRK